MNLRRGLTLPECEYYRRNCNFTDEEQAVFDLCVRNQSRIQIARALKMSLSTVDRRTREVKHKIEKIQSLSDKKMAGT